MKRLLVTIVAACGSSSESPDATVAAPRCDPSAPFGEPEPLAINSDLDDAGARFSPDESVVVFSRRSSTGAYDLYTATRDPIEGRFGTPELLTTVNSVNSELWPTLSPSGRLLAFDTDRAATVSHVYVSRRALTSERFGAPTVAVALNDREGYPMIANDRAMYFASDVRMGQGQRDIWRAEIDSTGAMAPPSALPGAINTADDEAAPAVTLDELHIFFRRTVGSESDVYTASRATAQEAFGTPSPVDGLARLGIAETPSWVSPDGCHVYFNSDASGNDDIYMAWRP
jgi:Tol biopolymer transport system component